MLERPKLWLSTANSSLRFPFRIGGGALAIHDAESRELVGHVAFYRRGWWPWLRPRRFAAYEAPDASLVFVGEITGWLDRMLTVRDADGNIVAYVREGYVLSPGGGALAHYQSVADRRRGSFLDPDGHELARWRVTESGTTVELLPVIQSEPFLAMGLFAAIVAMNTSARRT
jgi:hypothetical protein